VEIQKTSAENATAPSFHNRAGTAPRRASYLATGKSHSEKTRPKKCPDSRENSSLSKPVPEKPRKTPKKPEKNTMGRFGKIRETREIRHSFRAESCPFSAHDPKHSAAALAARLAVRSSQRSTTNDPRSPRRYEKHGNNSGEKVP
jgi:hypothetical protein